MKVYDMSYVFSFVLEGVGELRSGVLEFQGLWQMMSAFAQSKKAAS